MTSIEFNDIAKKADREAKAEAERKAKEEADRIARAEANRLAARKAEEERLAIVKAEEERKAKEEADRLAAQKAEEEQLAKADHDAKAEAERLAAQKAEAEQIAQQMVEAERLAAQKAERERLALAKVEADRKAKEDADRLAAQKAESDRLAKQKAEEERMAKARAEADRIASKKAEAELKAKEKIIPARVMPAEIKGEPLAVAPVQKKPASKVMMYGIVAVVVLVIAGIGISALSRGGNNNTPILTPTTNAAVIEPATEAPATPTTAPANTATIEPTAVSALGIGSTIISEKDGMTLLYVPAKEFTMGGNDGDDDEKPVHKVYLDAFWIDKTEVTTAMYAKCVQDGKCNQPRHQLLQFSKSCKSSCCFCFLERCQGLLRMGRSPITYRNSMGESRARHRWTHVSMGK